MSSLLIDCQPLQVLPSLAKAIGLNEAIFLQQLHYWLGRSKHEHDGRVWVYNTYEEWQAQFPFWSLDTMQRIAKKLVKSGLLVVHQFNKQNWDRRNWYSIDYEKLGAVEFGKPLLAESRKLRSSIPAECGSLESRKLRSSYKDQETTTETTITPLPPKPKKRSYKPDQEPVFLIAEVKDSAVIDADNSLRAGLKQMFPLLDFDSYYAKWWGSKFQKGGIGRRAHAAASLSEYRVSVETYFRNCADSPINHNGNKRGEQEYTGPVKSVPNPKLENCPDCRGMGNIRFERDGIWYAKPCKHERSGVAAA